MSKFPLPLLCLALAGCGSLTRHGPVDPALTAFIPPDSVALAGVRLDRLRATPIYRKLTETNPLRRPDPFRSDDIQDVLLASDGENVLAIARGAFRGKPPAGLTPVGGNIALGGTDAAVRAAIGQSKNGGREAPRDLMARAQALPGDAQIWAVVAGWRGLDPGQLRAMGNFANLDRVMRLVEGASLTVDLRTGAHAAFTGDCRTEADAKNLADSLRGLAALARMGLAHNKPDLQHAFDGLQVNQNGRAVQVNVDITEDLAEKLAQ
jgi:hypothetical protein